MKGVMGLFKRSGYGPPEGSDHRDSQMFTTAFALQGVDPEMLIPWEARANEVGAKRLSSSDGARQLHNLWAKDRYMSQLVSRAETEYERFFQFATIPADRDIIRQDEYSNFMLVLLDGTIAVDRHQPWGESMRMTEARPGDILGEMSLLDSGSRFSTCVSLTNCEVAVLGVEALDEMMADRPQLAASLIALLARKLSHRLRLVGARLSERSH